MVGLGFGVGVRVQVGVESATDRASLAAVPSSPDHRPSPIAHASRTHGSYAMTPPMRMRIHVHAHTHTHTYTWQLRDDAAYEDAPPCRKCATLLHAIGVPYAIHSTRDGKLKRLKLPAARPELLAVGMACKYARRVPSGVGWVAWLIAGDAACHSSFLPPCPRTLLADACTAHHLTRWAPTTCLPACLPACWPTDRPTDRPTETGRLTD